ncbi:MAG: hypothetical protein AB7O62_19620 [Pirellulales bacterium]
MTRIEFVDRPLFSLRLCGLAALRETTSRAMFYRQSTAILFGIALATLVAVPPARGQSFVQAVWPPVVQRGQSSRVELLGRELDGPTNIWTSLPLGLADAVPDIEGAAERPDAAERAVMQLRIAGESPLGVYGLRLATRSGLSNVHLFLVDELPVTIREESHPADVAFKTSLPACIAAHVRPAVVDRYEIEVVAGQRVSFEVIGNRLGHDFDPVVSIYSSGGKLLALRDNDPGLMFDCRFAHTFADAGTYQVRVHDARYEAGDRWSYVLRMGDFPAGCVAIPSAARPGERLAFHLPQLPGINGELDTPVTQPLGIAFQDIRLPGQTLATWLPMLTTDLPNQMESGDNHAFETAAAVSLPAALHGVLSAPGENDYFVFELRKGQKFIFQAETNSLGSAADLEMLLYAPMNREVRRVDDQNPTQEEGSFDFTADQDGPHHLLVRDMARDGGPGFAYRVMATAGNMRLQVAAEAEQLAIPQGSYQPLPLKITRTGFSAPIELSLLGAPPGVTIEPATIPADAGEIVCRISASDTAPLGLANLQVLAQATVENEKIQTLVQTQPLIDQQLKNVDLIPYGMRENQRHLPPSLTHNIALMVTEPSPFAVELPDELVVLPRYLQADFKIAFTPQPGFAAPLSYLAKGGQIGDEAEFRNQIYARFGDDPAAAGQKLGSMFTRNLVNLAKHRVDLLITADCGERRVTLVRAYTLDVRSAFEPKFEPATVSVLPGGKVKATALAMRLPGFDGEVTLTPNKQLGLNMPATVTIAAGQPSAEFEIEVAPTMNPGKYRVRFPATGQVGKYEENINGPELEIEVAKP